ncbi:MAG: ABC transporter permease [Christensenella sp.]|uniref:ABC transporter permease n=1 Tax=Christensenella sp. TaxID=1935934 RepID=UPI002B20D7DD|nr:ABC transporter permease [Christensenella sp.]MEA5004061.1 ABC transporter permease [Christensenella sp.]
MDKEVVLAKENTVWGKIKRFPQLSIVCAFIVLFVVLSIASDSFLTESNLINVVRQASPSLIVAIGMTFVLILGGIDLSVGSVACLAGTLAAGFMTTNGLPVPAGLLLGLLVGAAIGLINGIIIAKVKIPAFIVTLALMSTARGLALVYTGGRPITNIPEAALQLGRGYVGAIPVPVIIMIVVVAVAWIVLGSTKFGRHVYATGGNEECARLSGIKVDWTKIAVYTISGFTAGLTGILLTMRLASGQPTLGQGMELDAIAAVVLGGTALTGGKGYIFGTIIGCLFMQLLSNGFNILGISSFWQQVFTGIILLVAVSLYEKGNK